MGNVERTYVKAPQKPEEPGAAFNEGNPDVAISFIGSLRACTKTKDLRRGTQVHDDIVKRGLLSNNSYIRSALVNMYAKCGALKKAREVFDAIETRDVVLWNALISGYAQHRQGEEALKCFEEMQRDGFSPDNITFTCILKACGSMGASEKGRDFHTHLVRERLLEKDYVLANALVDMYAKCGVLDRAQEVFDEHCARDDVVSWNVLIAGYTQQEKGKEALLCFERMRLEGFSPNAVTFSCILKACGSVGASDVGKEIHAEIEKARLLNKDIVLANALIDMYAKCGLLEKAQEVFEEIPFRNVISWTTLIAGYIQHGHIEEALRFFKQMRLCGFPPNSVTFSCILKACSTIGGLEKGQEIHAQLVRDPLVGKDLMVGTALLDMYAKCAALEKAQEVFSELQKRDVVAWNALIAGYVQHEHGEKALKCFERMQLEGFTPDEATYACVLKACGSLGAATNGQKIHSDIVKQGSFETHKDVGIGLVIMYSSCGMLPEAQELVDKLSVRDVVTLSALMEGYSQLGEDEAVLNLFDKMVEEGVEPSLVTFTVVLNTCSHRGLLDEGQMYYELISRVYGMAPTLEHHTCMVDLFSRSGHLDKAVAVIKGMEMSPNLTMWHTLLGACAKWKNVECGEWAFENAVQLDERDVGAYICMSNVYTAAGRLEEASRIDALRVKKQAGTSLG